MAANVPQTQKSVVASKIGHIVSSHDSGQLCIAKPERAAEIWSVVGFMHQCVPHILARAERVCSKSTADPCTTIGCRCHERLLSLNL